MWYCCILMIMAIHLKSVSVLRLTWIISCAAETRANWTEVGSSWGESIAAARNGWMMWGIVSSDMTRVRADSCDCEAALLLDLAATVDELMSWVAAEAARLHACCLQIHTHKYNWITTRQCYTVAPVSYATSGHYVSLFSIYFINFWWHLLWLIRVDLIRFW